MFPEEIRLEKESDIPFGGTIVDYYKTEAELRKILTKFNCQKILIYQDGDKKRIAFAFNQKSYIFRIPKVYVKKGRGYSKEWVFQEHVGIRIVYQFLKTIVPYIDAKAVMGEQILLAARMVWSKEGEMVPLSDHIDNIIEKSGFEGYIPAFTIQERGRKDDV